MIKERWGEQGCEAKFTLIQILSALFSSCGPERNALVPSHTERSRALLIPGALEEQSRLLPQSPNCSPVAPCLRVTVHTVALLVAVEGPSDPLRMTAGFS